MCDTVDDIVDDHTPFEEQGLRRTLHVISNPFPDTWHTPQDNRENLSLGTIERVNRILRIFVAEYILELAK